MVVLAWHEAWPDIKPLALKNWPYIVFLVDSTLIVSKKITYLHYLSITKICNYLKKQNKSVSILEMIEISR